MSVRGQGGEGVRPPAEDNLSKAIVGVSIALALFTVGGMPFFGSMFAFGETRPLVTLTWFQPTAQSFTVLSAISIAVLCLGRYRALGGPWVFWTGAVFLANGTLGIFYMLSWPGLVGDRGVIAQLPNTASWIFMWYYSCFVLLLVAINARRPEHLPPSRSLAGYAIAAVVSALIGLLSVVFESALPVLVVGGVFTPLTLVWSWILVLLTAIAAASAYRRYRREQDAMLGYLALFLVVMAFGLLDSIAGGKRYDFWWYVGRLEFVAAYVVVLFGLLQEGYALFGRERMRAEERARLLRQVEFERTRWQSTVESMLDPVTVCAGPSPD